MTTRRSFLTGAACAAGAAIASTAVAAPKTVAPKVMSWTSDYDRYRWRWVTDELLMDWHGNGFEYEVMDHGVHTDMTLIKYRLSQPSSLVTFNQMDQPATVQRMGSGVMKRDEYRRMLAGSLNDSFGLAVPKAEGSTVLFDPT